MYENHKKYIEQKAIQSKSILKCRPLDVTRGQVRKYDFSTNLTSRVFRLITLLDYFILVNVDN